MPRQSAPNIVSGLFKRKGSLNWQLRICVPKQFQALEGRREIWCSMRTTDERVAQRNAVTVLAAVQARWHRDELADHVKSDVPRKHLHGAATSKRFFEQSLEAFRAARRRLPDDRNALQEHIATRELDLALLSRRKQDGFLGDWEAIADRHIAATGLEIAKDTDAYADLVERISDATIEALRVFNAESRGEPNPQPQSELVVSAIAGPEAGSLRFGTVMHLFEEYASQRVAEGAKRQTGIDEDRKVIRMFSTFVGDDRDITSIVAADVREFRDLLRSLPSRWQTRPEFVGMPMRDAASLAKARGMPGLSLTTVNKYLSTISPLFAWFINERGNMANPCDGLFHQHVKGRNPRPPFSAAQINQILASPLFTGCAGDGQEHLTGDVHVRDWRFWIPLLALFTGARAEELAQLRCDDVLFQDGCHCLLLRHAPERQQWIKNDASRIALIDDRLIEWGFLDHVNAIGAADSANDARLFPALTLGPRGKWADKPSRFWRDYLRRIGLKNGRDGFGLHSFRHALADRLRDEAGQLDAEVAIALGHSSNTVTSGYGRVSQRTVGKLREMFGGLVWRDIDFSYVTNSCRKTA